MDIEKLREDRFEFLKALYEAVSGKVAKSTPLYDIGKSLAFDNEHTTDIADFYSGKKLVKLGKSNKGRVVWLTAKGVEEAENSMIKTTGQQTDIEKTDSAHGGPEVDYQRREIENLRKLLNKQGKQNLANLLRNSYARIDESSTYGSLLFSLKSTYEIYSPYEDYQKLIELSDEDRKFILNSVLLIHPPAPHSAEIVDLVFHVDMDLTADEEHQYDVALSFAGEDRNYVDGVASALNELGLKVFYDSHESVTLWGKDLYMHLSEVFSKRSRYCVIFISKHYKDKLWPKHELESAFARAFEETGEYILPVRFDDTEIPGLRSTIGYLDVSEMPPDELASRIYEKLVT